MRAPVAVSLSGLVVDPDEFFTVNVPEPMLILMSMDACDSDWTFGMAVAMAVTRSASECWEVGYSPRIIRPAC